MPSKLDEPMVVAGAGIVGGTRQTFKVTVDYTMSLAEMIRAGNYDRTNPRNISEASEADFQIAGKGRKEEEIVLFHFGRVMSSDEVISEMSKAGYRPAFIEGLLALGADYPELQKQFSVVALGSPWQDPRGYRPVPCLDWTGIERRLYLDWFASGWVGCYRFAAVRK